MTLHLKPIQRCLTNEFSELFRNTHHQLILQPYSLNKTLFHNK